MSEILTLPEINSFIENGFLKINNAFSQTLAKEIVDILWKDIPFDRNTTGLWPQPVVRLGMYAEQPLIESLNNPHLYKIFDQLAGSGCWVPCKSVGSFPVRFPSAIEPSDTGWHVDAGFPGDDPADYFNWRVNIHSKGRALLMLVLYSDVSENDAPTLILKRSHMQVARWLATAGDQGLSFMELASRVKDFPKTEVIGATGDAGTVYLCHPFLAHAAQAHHGVQPKFMAQPPLLLREPLKINGDTSGSITSPGLTPIEAAIRIAIDSA